MKKCAFTILCLLVALGASAQRSDALDNVLRFVPLATTYTLKASGVESESSWTRLGVNSAVAAAVCVGTTLALKRIVSKQRPDESDYNAFPSGHASVAFAGAHLLHKEFGKVSPWISVGGYALATFTAIRRVARDRHDWLDVAAGAALGVASTEMGYWLGDKITGERGRVQVGVAPQSLTLVVNL